MKVVILVGGLGTRLAEETHLRPKPILWHILKIYSHHGINDFIICCGFKSSCLALCLCELGARVTGFTIEPDTEPALFKQLDLERRLDHNEGDVGDFEAVAALVASSQPELVLHWRPIPAWPC